MLSLNLMMPDAVLALVDEPKPKPKPEPTSITFHQPEGVFQVGTSHQFSVSVAPPEADQEVSWSCTPGATISSSGLLVLGDQPKTITIYTWIKNVFQSLNITITAPTQKSQKWTPNYLGNREMLVIPNWQSVVPERAVVEVSFYVPSSPITALLCLFCSEHLKPVGAQASIKTDRSFGLKGCTLQQYDGSTVTPKNIVITPGFHTARFAVSTVSPLKYFGYKEGKEQNYRGQITAISLIDPSSTINNRHYASIISSVSMPSTTTLVNTLDPSGRTDGELQFFSPSQPWVLMKS